MSSFREVDSTIDYRSDEKSLDGSYYRQQPNRRRFLRNLERQISDKHLKRRAQIIQRESINKYHHQYTNSTNGSSLSLNDVHYSYDYYRRSDQGGYYSVDDKKRSSFRKLLLFALMMTTLVFGMNVYFTYKLSGVPQKGIVQSIIFGGRENNDYETGERDDRNRSYQNLADTIKRLRNRRQILMEGGEKAGDLGERRENRQGGNREDDDRLKRLEQKIQIEQSKKVRQEFLSSNKNRHDTETGGQDANESRHTNVDGSFNDHQQHEQQHVNHQSTTTNSTSTTASKEKLMSDNIAALKLLNDKKKKENDQINDAIDHDGH